MSAGVVRLPVSPACARRSRCPAVMMTQSVPPCQPLLPCQPACFERQGRKGQGLRLLSAQLPLGGRMIMIDIKVVFVAVGVHSWQLGCKGGSYTRASPSHDQAMLHICGKRFLHDFYSIHLRGVFTQPLLLHGSYLRSGRSCVVFAGLFEAAPSRVCLRGLS